MARKVVRRSDHQEAEGIGEPDLNHVPLDRLAQPNASVIPLRDDIHEALFDDHFNVDAAELQEIEAELARITVHGGRMSAKYMVEVEE